MEVYGIQNTFLSTLYIPNHPNSKYDILLSLSHSLLTFQKISGQPWLCTCGTDKIRQDSIHVQGHGIIRYSQAAGCELNIDLNPGLNLKRR